MDIVTIWLIALIVFSVIGFLVKGKLVKRWIRYFSLIVSVAIFGFYSVDIFGSYSANCIAGPGQFQDIFLNIREFSDNIPFYVRIIVLIVSTIIFGALFCGWVCPMGGIQEFLFRKNIAVKIPSKIDTKIRYLRYFALASLIIAPFLIKGEKICKLNPFSVASDLSGPLYLVIAFAVIAFASLFIYRPWCRYICPFGALFSLLSKFSFLKIKFDEEECVKCNLCRSNCSMDAIDGKNCQISELKCIRCMECLIDCPKAALKFSFRRKLKK